MAKKSEKMVKEGDTISVSYEGRLSDGKVFDKSEEGKPLVFTVGDKGIIKGFSTGVIGMKEGEEKEIVIEPEHAYGKRNEMLHAKVEKSKFPKEFELKIGQPVFIGTPDGRKIGAIIEEVGENHVDIDLNHPLAGRKLTFKINITEIKEN